MGHIKFSNKNHTADAPKFPPSCIHCITQQWWSKPYEGLSGSAETQQGGRPPTAITCCALFVFPPLLGHAAFLRCPGDLRWRSQHHSRRLRYCSICYLHFPLNHQKGTLKIKLWQTDGQTRITLSLPLSVRGWMSAGKEGKQSRCPDLTQY